MSKSRKRVYTTERTIATLNWWFGTKADAVTSIDSAVAKVAEEAAELTTAFAEWRSVVADDEATLDSSLDSAKFVVAECCDVLYSALGVMHHHGIDLRLALSLVGEKIRLRDRLPKDSANAEFEALVLGVLKTTEDND
jgi:phosphoribosyl-ATP pyrophosphohydrolase